MLTASRSRWLGLALLGIASGLAAVALLGPVGLGVIRWRISDLVRNQLVGLDAISLVLVAPLAAIAGTLTLRGRALGPVLGLPPAFYVAYMVPQYVLRPEYLHLDGNNRGGDGRDGGARPRARGHRRAALRPAAP
jgi:hypothetical protein